MQRSLSDALEAGCREFRTRHGFKNLKLRSEQSGGDVYWAEGGHFVTADDVVPVIGLKLHHTGRFGNLLHQYINMILIAEKADLAYIQLGRHELFDLEAPIRVGRVTFLPADEPLPPGGGFLTGGFFDTSSLVPVLDYFLARPNEEAYCRVSRHIVRPYLYTNPEDGGTVHHDDELTVHIRSGDIFAFAPEQTDKGYRQPPLAFYTLVVERLLRAGTITRVRLVFEDRGNPCVDAFEAYLVERKIPFRIASGTLAKDMSALIDAPHLVFGFGTFGYAVCRLSRHVKTVHYFEPELGGDYSLIPGIDAVISVRDKAGKYIKAFEHAWPEIISEGEWRNTPEQRDLMCSYPAASLEIVEKARHPG